MERDNLIPIEKTVIPPIKKGTEENPIYTTRGLVYWDKTTGLYYGVVEGEGKDPDTFTMAYRHSSDIPKSRIKPIMDKRE